MKNKINKSIYFLLVVLVPVFSSCSLDPIDNPNGPTIESFETGATEADLNLLVAGLESIIRVDMEFYYETVNIVGREFWDLNNIDPRFTGELLGAQGAVLDNNGFLTTRSFAARYRAVKNANLLLEALANANVSFTAAEANGYSGFAKTIEAYELLLVLNRQFQNGIRIEVSDPDDLGPFVDYDPALAGILGILDEADTELANASFSFVLSSGFDYVIDPATGNFDQVAGVKQFNRALAARIALYQNATGITIISLLNDSFFDLNGSLGLGPAHVFGSSGNDILNPIFNVADQDLYTVHPTFLTDAETGDLRVVNKTRPYDTAQVAGGTITADNLTGDTQVFIYATNVSPVPIIRNEELILIYAEANVGTDNPEAVNAINVIRTAAGLANYSGGTSNSELIDEILVQRRYSLYAEGHRWIDLRRFSRLSEVPIDRAGDVVHVQFPRPVKEL